jgi:hypothetical protein
MPMEPSVGSFTGAPFTGHFVICNLISWVGDNMQSAIGELGKFKKQEPSVVAWLSLWLHKH